jgi:hypothetical protein
MSAPSYTLESVSIHRGYGYSAKAQPLRATVKFKHPAGSVELDLSEEASAAVLSVIADQVVAAASMRAEDMMAAFIDGAAQARAVNILPAE